MGATNEITKPPIMETPIQPLSTSIMTIMYSGDVVFAVSGALTAAKYRMDVLGFVLIGTITGIGGGTLRDLLLGRDVWWTHDPTELLLCIAASLGTFFFIKHDIGPARAWCGRTPLASPCSAWWDVTWRSSLAHPSSSRCSWAW